MASFEKTAIIKISSGKKSPAHPQPDYSTIKSLVASGGQPSRSVEEESVVRVVGVHRGVDDGWVSVVRSFVRAAAPELELTKDWDRKESKCENGAD